MQYIEKAKPFLIVDSIKYIHNSIATNDIIRKSTGQITIMAFDANQELAEQVFPSDSFIHIVEGKAEITIAKIPYPLLSGQGIIIPAHTQNFIKSNCRFKMILIAIKSGCD